MLGMDGEVGTCGLGLNLKCGDDWWCRCLDASHSPCSPPWSLRRLNHTQTGLNVQSNHGGYQGLCLASGLWTGIGGGS